MPRKSLRVQQLRADSGGYKLAAMNGTWSWQGFLAEFTSAAEADGFTRRVLLETSAGPVAAWEKKGAGPAVYLSAGIHGDEPAGPLALLELLREGFFHRGISWSLCPALNPTGLAAGSRENDAGLDLNRDYRRRQSAEVALHADWLVSKPIPDLFLSLHEDWEARGFYFYEINLGDDDPSRAGRILDAVKPWLAVDDGHQIDGHAPRGPGWIFHAAEADVPEGWPEAIFLAHLGCPLSFTFETPSHAGLAERVAAQCAVVRAALAQWLPASRKPSPSSRVS